MLEIILHIKHPKQSFRRARNRKKEYREIPRGKSIVKFHCIKYAKIRVFTDAILLHLLFCPYTGECGPRILPYKDRIVFRKTRVLAYFMQCLLVTSFRFTTYVSVRLSFTTNV